jgi:hypothetical protein
MSPSLGLMSIDFHVFWDAKMLFLVFLDVDIEKMREKGSPNPNPRRAKVEVYDVCQEPADPHCAFREIYLIHGV